MKKFRATVTTAMLAFAMAGCQRGPVREADLKSPTVVYETDTAQIATLSEAEQEMGKVLSETLVIAADKSEAEQVAQGGEILYGVISGDGEIKIPFRFNSIKEIQDGYLCVLTTEAGDEIQTGFDVQGNPLTIDPNDYNWEQHKIGNGDFYQQSTADETKIDIYRTTDQEKLLSYDANGTFQSYIIRGTRGNRALLITVADQTGNYFEMYDYDLLLQIETEEVAEALIIRMDGFPKLNLQLENYGDFFVFVQTGERDRYGLMDLTGEIILDNDYNYLEVPESYYDQKLLIAYNEEDLAGYIDDQGNQFIDFQYQEAYPFYRGYALVKPASKDGWQIINRNGDYLLDQEFSANLGQLESNFGITEYAEFNSQNGDQIYVKYDGSPVDFNQLLELEAAAEASYYFYPMFQNVIMVERYWEAGDIYARGLFDLTANRFLVPLPDELNYRSDLEYIDEQDTKGVNPYIEYREESRNEQFVLNTIYNLDGTVIVNEYERLIAVSRHMFLVEKDDYWCWYNRSGTCLYEFPNPLLIGQQS